MQRTLQTTDTSGNRTVSICAGRRCYTYFVKVELLPPPCSAWIMRQKVEHSGIQFGIVFMLHHIKKVLCNRDSHEDDEYADFYLNRVTVDIVCIKAMMVGNLAINSMLWRIRLSRLMSSGFGSKVYISSTQRARMFHDVAAFQLDDMGNRTMIKRHIIVQEFLKASIPPYQATGPRAAGRLLPRIRNASPSREELPGHQVHNHDNKFTLL